MDEFSARELCGLMYAVAKLGITPEDTFRETWLEAMTQRFFDSPSPQLLSNAIYALSKLRFELPSEFCEKWLSTSASCIDKMTTKDVAQILWAIGSLSSLGLQPSATFLSVFYEALERLLPQLSVGSLVIVLRSIVYFSELSLPPGLEISIVRTCEAEVSWNPSQAQVKILAGLLQKYSPEERSLRNVNDG